MVVRDGDGPGCGWWPCCRRAGSLGWIRPEAVIVAVIVRDGGRPTVVPVIPRVACPCERVEVLAVLSVGVRGLCGRYGPPASFGLKCRQRTPEVAVISDVYPIRMRSTGISARTMVTEE
jgi:hypothetical protein